MSPESLLQMCTRSLGRLEAGRKIRRTRAVAAMPGGEERGGSVEVLDTKWRDFQAFDR
jgi:hypothetical protein